MLSGLKLPLRPSQLLIFQDNKRLRFFVADGLEKLIQTKNENDI